MIEVLSKILKWVEIGSAIVVVVAIFFKLLGLPMSAELILFSFLTLATVYFLWAFSVAPPNSSTGKMGFMDVLPITLRKIIFIGISVLFIAYLFTILHLKGANEMMIIGLLTLIICVGMSMLMILGNRERMNTLKSPLIRAVIALLFYFVTPLLK